MFANDSKSHITTPGPLYDCQCQLSVY